ncbi:CD109 antigen-like [Cydia fagiglandana]|uniref:CD109 antigen-like n=1 Tax=Cydia fagiglandana TaxID=1458189 RepID=UPI002FEE588B
MSRRMGEQVGLRVVVFNYQPQAVEAVVVLSASPDYKFVHVEENGIVSIQVKQAEHSSIKWKGRTVAGRASKSACAWSCSTTSRKPSRRWSFCLPRLTTSRTFFNQVEGPDRCRQGEQVGLRVVVFNYQPQAVEAVVVLSASPDYKFVHVEENGIVRSYNPRTSFGEHQFFVYIAAGDAATVHVPVVPTRLGDVHVHLHASTLQGQHKYTKKITVEADGLPQHRHQSVLLDLSNRAYVFQYMHVNVTETPIIPYEVDRYYVFGSNRARVSVVGDVVGPLFPTMPINATSLLRLPMDSAEQNMFSFAANMYFTLYMRLINQRNRTLEKDAFYHMNILYQRQLSFMKPDGSFSLFRSDW